MALVLVIHFGYLLHPGLSVIQRLVATGSSTCARKILVVESIPAVMVEFVGRSKLRALGQRAT